MIKSNLDPDKLPLDQLAIFNEWSALRAQIKKLQDKCVVLAADFEARCTHEHRVTKSHYFDGSYYDTSYTDYLEECEFCSFKTERHRQNHGHYG